jgi:hypothetical protein
MTGAVVFVTLLEEKGDNCFKFSDDDEQKVRKFIETGETVETGERPTVTTSSGSPSDVSEEDVARPLGGELGESYAEHAQPRQGEGESEGLSRDLETLNLYTNPTRFQRMRNYLLGKSKKEEELIRGLDEDSRKAYLRRIDDISGGKKTKKKPRRKTQLKSRKYNHKTLKRKSKTYRRRRNR